ncbi:MAG: Hydrolase [Alphaproteobacteria bacterium]|nr:Hydrolase [Alphaproteobacteria bacterium]
MAFERESFRASDGVELAAYRWRSNGTPRALLFIAHGMAEHAARYDAFASFLAQHGILVEAHDHRGHGRTARAQDELGFFAESGGWQRVVDDVRERLSLARKNNPGLKIILFGHSMGSFVGQQILYESPGLMDAAILSGSNGKPLRLASVGRLVARLERLRLGRHGRSKLLTDLSFGPFNKRFAPNRTDFDWLSRDTAQVDAYVADPLCGFLCTSQFWVDLLDALLPLAKEKNRDRVPEALPVLIFSGDEDPVGVNLSELVKGYRGNGMTHVAVKLYPGGRHEMLNEINRADVQVDVLAWLDAFLAGSPVASPS